MVCFQYMPPVAGRSNAGYVGLKNGGATCYMNSVLQQLFMTPGVAENMLGIDDDEIKDEWLAMLLYFVPKFSNVDLTHCQCNVIVK